MLISSSITLPSPEHSGHIPLGSLKEKLEALEKAAQAASAQMYQQQSADPNAGAGANNTNNDENVVDAEFEEKK